MDKRPHSDGGGMPPACDKALEHGLTRYILVQMKGLRIEILREFAYLLCFDRVFSAVKFSSHSQIIEKEFSGLRYVCHQTSSAHLLILSSVADELLHLSFWTFYYFRATRKIPFVRLPQS
jgi:hypothetical protein